LLKREIEDLGISKKALAEKCHMSRYTLDNKLNKPETILADEALYFADALRITDTEKLMSIFFAREVEENIN
jgi:transcriptional regulator with XRE-family HTH domain